MNDYLKKRSDELDRSQAIYNDWYNNLTHAERDEFEAYCRHHMTDEEYNANPPVYQKKKEFSYKDAEMLKFLFDGKITETEWIEYKQPKTKGELILLTKTIMLVRKWKNFQKQYRTWTTIRKS
jgi:hypothetical protein